MHCPDGLVKFGGAKLSLYENLKVGEILFEEDYDVRPGSKGYLTIYVGRTENKTALPIQFSISSVVPLLKIALNNGYAIHCRTYRQKYGEYRKDIIFLKNPSRFVFAHYSRLPD